MFRRVLHLAIIAVVAIDTQCPWQLQSSRGYCLLQPYSSFDVPRPKISTKHIETVPTSQRSSHCSNCLYHNGTFFLSSDGFNSSLDVSHSQWSEFFHWYGNDRVSVLHSRQHPSAQYIIHQPVFYIPVITLHVGHVIIDIVEQLYNNMMEFYGTIPLDAVIILDVAQASEREVLQRKIDALIYNEESYGVMLRWFTSVPILSALTLQRSQLCLLFADLHIGLDIEHTYFNRGYHYHPHTMNIADRSVQALAANYQRFRDYVHLKARLSYDVAYAAPALLVQRSNNRVINNFIDILLALNERGICYNAFDFDGLAFSEQLKYLQSTDVLVATAGTALHNMLFMRPGTSVIILMQPEWCDWAWQYSNQAVLLDIHATIICGDEAEHKYFSWTKNFWRQGPRMTKLTNFTVDVPTVLSELQRALSSNDFSRDITKHAHDLRSSATSHIASSCLEIVLSEVVADRTTTDTSSVWNLRLMGEVTSSSLHADVVYASLPYISVCMNFPLTPLPTPACYPFTSMMNYYSDIIVNSDSHVLWLHMWLQTSVDGGKLAHSDYFDVIDARISLAELRKMDVIPTEIPHNCRNRINSENRHALSRILNCVCKYENFSDTKCFEFISQLYRDIHHLNALTAYNLPFPQLVPSPQTPFIFLHFEKSAGTTLREFIAEGAKKKGLDYFIPCHGSTHCITFSLNDTYQPIDTYEIYRNTSVVAGHFEWGIWNQLPSMLSPKCLLIGRHPVDRAISYYYQRCFREETCQYYQRKINDFTIDELLDMALMFRHGLKYNETTIVVADDGITNAVCRAMVNKRKTIGVVATPGVPMPLPDDLTDDDVELALQRAEKCAVGILEQWDDTRHVLRHWFPWFQVYDNRRKMSLFKTKESMDVIRHDIRLALESVNYCDMKLYDKMVSIFKKQLEVLREYEDVSFFGRR